MFPKKKTLVIVAQSFLILLATCYAASVNFQLLVRSGNWVENLLGIAFIALPFSFYFYCKFEEKEKTNKFL